MTAVLDAPRRTHRGFDWFWILATLIIVAHGCHGDDIDHEPAILHIEPER